MITFLTAPDNLYLMSKLDPLFLHRDFLETVVYLEMMVPLDLEELLERGVIWERVERKDQR